MPILRAPPRGLIFTIGHAGLEGGNAHFVNPARGDLTFLWVDDELPNDPFHVGRIYSSERASEALLDDDFSLGWRLTPGDFILWDGLGPMTVHTDDGSIHTFSDLGASSMSALGITQRADGTLEAFQNDGTVKMFSRSSRPELFLLTYIQLASGAWLRLDRLYDRVTRIESSSGVSLEFHRQGLAQGRKASGWNRVEYISDKSNRVIIFRYDNEGRLSETVTPQGERFGLSYNVDGRLERVEDPEGGSLLGVEYEVAGWVRNQRIHGSTLPWLWSDLDQPEPTATENEKGTTRNEHGSTSGRRGSPGGPGANSVRDTGAFDELPMYQDEHGCNWYEPGWGYCDASTPGWQCVDYCGGGSGGGGGGGGDGGDCDFAVAGGPTQGLTCHGFAFHIETIAGCPSWASWIASPYATAQFGSGSYFTTAWLAAGTQGVSATIGSRTRTMLVSVLPRPWCNLTPAGPQSVLIGEPTDYTYTQSNCYGIQWNGGSDTCPSTGTSNPWTTAFVQSGARDIAITGNDGCSFETTAVRLVSVTPCTVSMSGPSSGRINQILCYDATPIGAFTGSYSWSAAGGSPESGSEPRFCTSFGSSGPHSVTVSFNKTVTGCASPSCGSATQPVAVTDPPPQVTVNSSNPQSLVAGQSLSITATGRDGFGNLTAGTYSWTTSNASILQLTPSGSQVQVKGIGAGSATLSVSFTTSAGTGSHSIQVNVQDVTLEISSTPASYLPTEQNEVQLIATLMPPAAMNRLRVSLSDITSFPGTSMNFGSGTESDFYFDASANPGLNISADGLTAESPTAVHSLMVTVWSRDNGGRVKVSAETLDFPVRMSPTRAIPLDTDGDTLPDAWESASGFFSATAADTDGDGIQDDAEDDDPTPAVSANAGPAAPAGAQTGQGLAGDGLSAYEEYRGFRSLGIPIRTSPSTKDVFIHSDLTSYGIGYTSALIGFVLHEVALDEWSGVVSRLINANRGTIPGTDQAAIRIAMDPNQNLFGVLGQTYKTTAGLQNETPNETSRSEINLAAINNDFQSVFLPGPDGLYGTPDDDRMDAVDVYTAADIDQVVRGTIDHEAAHNLHVEHEFFYRDVILVSVGKGGLRGDFANGADAVGSGPDGTCQTAAAAGDVQVTAVGQAGSVCVKTGKDGIANTTAHLNDQQIIQVNQGSPNARCICQGEDGIMNTVPGGDDSPPVSVGGNCGTAILSGANGICESFPPVSTRRTIMSTELFLPVPSSYDSVDRGQVRVHVKHP